MIDTPKSAGTIAILNREHSNKRVLGLCLLLIVLSYWLMADVLHYHDDAALTHDHQSCLMLHATLAVAVNTFPLHLIFPSEIIRLKMVSVVYKVLIFRYHFIRAPPLNYT